MCCSIASSVMAAFSPKAFSTLSPFRLRKRFHVSVRKQASPFRRETFDFSGDFALGIKYKCLQY